MPRDGPCRTAGYRGALKGEGRVAGGGCDAGMRAPRVFDIIESSKLLGSTCNERLDLLDAAVGATVPGVAMPSLCVACVGVASVTVCRKAPPCMRLLAMWRPGQRWMRAGSDEISKCGSKRVAICASVSVRVGEEATASATRRSKSRSAPASPSS